MRAREGWGFLGDLVGGRAMDRVRRLLRDEAGGLNFRVNQAAVGFAAYRSSAFSLANNAQTAVDLNAEYFDTDNFHDNSTNPSKGIVPTGLGGKFIALAQSDYAASALGRRQTEPWVNGSPLVTRGSNDQAAPVSASLDSTPQALVFPVLVATDYVQNVSFQNTGGAINLGANFTFLAMLRVGT